MNPESSHEAPCGCEKPDCTATKDTQQKAKLLGSSCTHTAHILHMLQDTVSRLPDTSGPRVAALTVDELLSLLQDKKDLDSDTRLLVSDCCKFLAVIIRHLCSRKSETTKHKDKDKDKIPESMERAAQTIRLVALTIHVVSAKPVERKFWVKRTAGGIDKATVDHLRKDLQESWERCYQELPLKGEHVVTSIGNGMSKQLDAMVEMAVYIAEQKRQAMSRQRLDSKLRDTHLAITPGINPSLGYNGPGHWRGLDTSLHSYGDGETSYGTALAQDNRAPLRSNSLPQPTPKVLSNPASSIHIPPPTASPSSVITLNLPNVDE